MRRKHNRFRQRISCAIAVIGVILLVGTGGAGDAGNISAAQIVWQLVAGLVMLGGGATLGGLFR